MNWKFWKKQEEQTEQTEQEEPMEDEGPTPLLNFGIMLYEDGSLSMNCDWISNHAVISKNLGTLLYQLNSGNLKSYILKSFMDGAKGDMMRMDFISKVFERWTQLEEDNDNEPVIQPNLALKPKNDIEETE